MAGKDDVEAELPADGEENQDASFEPGERVVKLPLTRIKTIIKMDPDVTLASQDAVITIAKATELFLQSMAKDAYKYTQQTKRKTVQRKDLDLAVENVEEYAFLEVLGHPSGRLNSWLEAAMHHHMGGCVCGPGESGSMTRFTIIHLVCAVHHKHPEKTTQLI